MVSQIFKEFVEETIKIISNKETDKKSVKINNDLREELENVVKEYRDFSDLARTKTDKPSYRRLSDELYDMSNFLMNISKKDEFIVSTLTSEQTRYFYYIKTYIDKEYQIETQEDLVNLFGKIIGSWDVADELISNIKKDSPMADEFIFKTIQKDMQGPTKKFVMEIIGAILRIILCIVYIGCLMINVHISVMTQNNHGSEYGETLWILNAVKFGLSCIIFLIFMIRAVKSHEKKQDEAFHHYLFLSSLWLMTIFMNAAYFYSM